MNDFIRTNIGQPLDAGELLAIAAHTKRTEQLVLASAGIVGYAKVSKAEFTQMQVEQALQEMQQKFRDVVMRNSVNLAYCTTILGAINLIDCRSIIEGVK